MIKKYKILKRNIEIKEQNIAKLKEICYGSTFNNPKEEKVNSSRKNIEDNQHNMLQKILDLEIKLNKDKMRCLRLYNKIYKVLNMLDNELYKIIISEYDINELTFEEIAEKYNYSYEYIKRLHSLAIKSFYKTI